MTNSRRAPGKAVTRKPTKQKKPKKTPGQRVRRVLLWLAALALVGLVAGLGLFVVLYQTIDMPDPNEEFKTQTSFVYYEDGESEVGRYVTQNRVAVPLDDMPQHLQDAVVAAEDKTFWTNSGIDPKGIIRSAFSNARAGETVAGGSTITQQYVKILYLSSERALSRKVKEAILSLKIQREVSKREILEGYLNTIYFGRGAYGVQAASQAYFGKDVKDINLRESAVLASVLNSPNALDPANGKEARAELKDRFTYTLGRMSDDRLVQEEKTQKAARRLPKFPKQKAESAQGGQRGHTLKLVRDELLRLGYTEQEIVGGGLRVTTTLDPTMMEQLEESVIEQRPEGFGDKQLHIGAATVEPGTGALKAFYGGQDFLDSQINWAATGGMAGSTMKAFTVAAAIEEGFSLRDTFQGNSPYRFPGGLEVNNAGEGAADQGSAISMTRATALSTNTAFVDMSDSMEDGPRKIYRTMLRAGLPPEEADSDFPGIPMRSTDLSPEDTLITLGKARISPINMANAYATFANFGERADVHVVAKVVEADGETSYSRKVETTQAIDPEVNADTVYALQDVVKNGSGRAAQSIGRPAAGKTGTATAGTSQDSVHVSSSWFVGFTPQLSTAVMYVRGDGDDKLDEWLPSFYGGTYPAQTWAAIMDRLSEGMEVEEFPEPVFLDGGEPSSSGGGEAPPPSQPKPKPKPSKKPIETPSQEPEPEPEPQPSETPTPTNQPEPEPSPTPPAPSPTPPAPSPTPPAPSPTPPGDGAPGGFAPAAAPGRTEPGE
ncbi:transglycosylase domain-containing protein [Nocardioides malaquae]|uniref:transglycosylase domain-containing protein n=1 Tax=Nocardioides malaquae TaxID=2773426 RepID=UPI0029D418D2|nr:transglycosylase domain-containing protein [Nocardioides malaquae]